MEKEIINKAVRKGIIVPVGKELDVSRYDYFLCKIEDNGWFYGGFVVDENGIVIKATLNIVYTRGEGKKVYPVQMIVEDDNISFSDFFYDNESITGLIIPSEFPSYLTCWRDFIKKFKEKKIYISKYNLLSRECVCTKDFIEDRIKDSQIEKHLNNQLTCSRIIKEGLDNIAGSNLTIANAIIEGSRIIAWQDKYYGAFAGI